MPSPFPSVQSSRNRKIFGVFALVLAAALVSGIALQVSGAASSGESGASGAQDAPNESTSPPAGSDSASSPSAEQRQQRFAQLAKLARRDPGAASAIGSVDAPVVMIEYADFQCPFCRKFAQDTQPKLVEKYVEKGVLRIEWRNFPIFGAESMNAAKAVWAAGQQGRFWQYHEALYAHAPGKKSMNSGAFSEDKLVALAKKIGIPNLEQFRADMNSDAAAQAVGRDRQEGYRIGVTSTPAFLINGRPVLGAQPTRVFVKLIENARAAAAKAADKDGNTGARQ